MFFYWKWDFNIIRAYYFFEKYFYEIEKIFTYLVKKEKKKKTKRNRNPSN